MDNKLLAENRESFWHKTSQMDEYPQLNRDLTVDVAIIGGGMAGILAAYQISGSGKRVALLEARKLVCGTTGYTTSKLSAQHNLIYDQLIRRYGIEKARRYYDANMEGIEMIKEIADKHQIKCELKEQDAYVYTQIKANKNRIEREAQAYKSLSIDGGLTEKLPVNLEIEAAVVMHKQFEFHPVMFLSGVLKELEKRKVLIFENTMVTEINDNVSLKTDKDKIINCKKAICTSHYPVDDPDKFYTKKMNPEMSFATIYELDDSYPGGMYISYDYPRRTFRGVKAKGEKYILVGGESHPLGTASSDLERYQSIVDFAKKTFAVKELIARWSSHDYLTKDGLPFVGLSHPKRKNIFVVTGLNKWGLSNAAISAKILSDEIEGKINPYQDLFKPNREVPDLDKPEEKKSDQKEKSSTPKTKINDLENGEALTYEKDDKRIGIFKDDHGKLHHLDLTCTHLGCGLKWNDGDKTWDCPCHGSRFNATGHVIAGPAMKSLKKLM